MSPLIPGLLVHLSGEGTYICPQRRRRRRRVDIDTDQRVYMLYKQKEEEIERKRDSNKFDGVQ